ncbi:DNA-3-methyladenine glycosylase 2 family protein [Thermoleptolyngbya sichuanensis A183]|uniref:DNA-3-methyladenine glycosylase II n=1 Tax=Thermoleptolyngbya sichuanensis A183 TaxID=2737172 RepID=A0A6M8BBT1_9CYAN|nr:MULTISPECIES: DNA-3-methyladenine glycosylase [Thermoleptolyngbya]QKD82403.1 DNA-3-methyladenine glycosylase 2 family protein [Thermoleptolyngbya sichuanensis A183]QKD83592.1 DNA-3-methyladenine glycosylase 2 family protein [Thermoleptolyngbya sichuanensis A183]
MDYSRAIAHLQAADPILAATIERSGPCTLWHDRQTGDLLESLAESIIYQQLSGKAAGTIHRRFLALYPHTPHPTAAEILATPDEVLRGAGLSRAKTLYVKDLAQKVLDGLPSLEDLEQLEADAIIRTLTQVKGIGKWTAEMLLIFRLHRWDVLPVDDLGIRNGMRLLYSLPDLPNKNTMLQIAEPWRPYRTIAAWYLWRSVDIKAMGKEG